MTQEPEPKITVITAPARTSPVKDRIAQTKPRRPAAKAGSGAGIVKPEDKAQAESAAFLDGDFAEPEQLAVDSPAIADPPLFAPEKPTKTEPKSGPPTLGEWQSFFGRIVVRGLTQAYIAMMLRDVELSPREETSIMLEPDDLKEIAAPFAEFANKNKTMRKHGRQIISFADSWEALLALGIWMRRVNKISRKHRPRQGKQIRSRTHVHSESQQQGPMEGMVYANGSSGENHGEGYSIPVDNFGAG